MGGVYYARDEELGRFVAIKVMLESLGSDPAFIETFRREAQAVAKLNHPNIAQIYSYGQEKGQPYIVMELVSGERVDAMVDANGGLKPALAMRIGLDIAQGLSAADEAGLVHGDIKPENILLDIKGRAKLVDFGLATVAHQAAGEGIWGTPYYIAPEKIRRQKVDARSDIYSLGATLFHMLTGKPPFEGKTPVDVVKARLEKPPPDPRKHMPDLPEVVAQTILRMLAVDRTERYPNYISLLSDLRRSVEAFGTLTSQTARFATGKQIRIKRRVKSGVAVLPARSEVSEPKHSTISRKLLIHKGGQPTQPVKSNHTTRTGTGAITISISKHSTQPPPPSPEVIAARKERERRHSRHVWVTIMTIFMLLAIAGGTAALLLHRQKEMDRRKALFALSNARIESSQLYTAMSNDVDRIATYAKRAEQFETDIQEAVERLTGSKLQIAPPEPPANPVPMETGTATNGLPAATATAPAETAPSAADPATGPAEPPATRAEPAGYPNAPATAPKHPVIPPARDGLQAIREVVELKKQASDKLIEAFDLSTAVQAIGNPANAVQAIGNAASATNDTAKLRAMGTQLTELADLAKTSVERAEASQKVVMAFRQAFDRAEAERLAAEKKAEEDRRAAEEAERKRQAYIARTASEIQQAKNDQADMRILFDANNFLEAIEQLKQRVGNYETEKGKSAIQLLIGRYEHLARMKSALIAGMQQTRYPWGWGFGNSARDIMTADEKGITAKGLPAPVPWSSVTTPQMLKLVDFYLSSPLKARSRIDLAFGAAIYCDEFGQQGRDLATRYAERANALGLPQETRARFLDF
jgi:serine/threonine protein kinase